MPASHMGGGLRNNRKIRIFLDQDDEHIWVDCPQLGGKLDVYQELRRRLNSECWDDPTFIVQSPPFSDCASFRQHGCDQDIGQMTACPQACGTCVDWRGTIECPPAREFCASEVVDESRAFPTREDDFLQSKPPVDQDEVTDFGELQVQASMFTFGGGQDSNGIALGLIIGACIIGVILLIALVLLLRKRLRAPNISVYTRAPTPDRL
eukprot:c17248_g1_i3.p1 GENE.c17248_g1_i3~~c17248_g1_i3.p1  ORF type:complete len:208 (-),score=34.01 c17248_g1_i3:92-715(-)